jgi:hypothetical protein
MLRFCLDPLSFLSIDRYAPVSSSHATFICTKHVYQGEVIQLLPVGGGEFHASKSHTSSSNKLSFLSQDLGKEDSAHDAG